MYYVYVLQSLKDMKFYVGFTKDLKLRFDQHEKGFVESTKIDAHFVCYITRQVLIEMMRQDAKNI